MKTPQRSPKWECFWVESQTLHPLPKTRPIQTPEGIGDRIRTAAFAEIQALEGFRWAAHHFQEAPVSLRETWLGLAHAEHKHLNWLKKRMTDLGQRLEERPVSDRLWQSFHACETAEAFALFMAKAEERGRVAGERFCKTLHEIDPVSSRLFGQIALEENEHIETAVRYFPHHRKTIETLRSSASKSP